MSAWTDTADGHHCTAHDQTFARGEVCQRCILDPGPGPEVEQAEHDEELAAREADLTTDAKFWRRQARELWTDGTALDRNTAVKAADTGLKYERLALELREKRARREHVNALKRAAMQMAGLRGHN